jgi:hypothetical protein
MRSALSCRAFRTVGKYCGRLLMSERKSKTRSDEALTVSDRSNSFIKVTSSLIVFDAIVLNCADTPSPFDAVMRRALSVGCDREESFN